MEWIFKIKEVARLLARRLYSRGKNNTRGARGARSEEREKRREGESEHLQ